MKILFVTAEPHPTFRADVRVLFGKYLPRHGVYSDLLTLPAGERAEPWPAGQALLGPRPRNKWHKQWVQFRHDLSLFRRARQGYDAVQVRDRVLAGVLGLWAARRAGIPFFYWASYPKPEFRSHAAREQGLKGGLLKWLVNKVRGALSGWVLYRYLLPRSSHVFVQSDAMRTTFASRGVPLDLMTPVPMGVEMESIGDAADLPAALVGRLSGKRVIVYAGALDEVRQPGLMLQAMQMVVPELPDAVLLVVGDSLDPGELPRLRASVESMGLTQHVEFTGWLQTRLVQACLKCSEIGLSLIPRGSLYDVSSPTKLAEYFAQGLAVVANDLPDQAKVLLEARAGDCVPLEAGAVAREILRLLNDAEGRVSQARAGRAYVMEHRSYEAIAATVADVYRRRLVAQRDSTQNSA